MRLCGKSLAGVVREHILPIAYGEGSNGKSTILGTLLKVFGEDYAMKSGSDFLMSKKYDGHSTERMDLHGKRFVLAIENRGN